jgi:crotonobetainyl-CoA:carnitine CoA-transferase CaiB-like acyl-CoA transferase
VRLSRTTPDGTRAGPALGADTDAVLAQLGYGPEEVGRLKAAGAVADPEGVREGSFLA